MVVVMTGMRIRMVMMMMRWTSDGYDGQQLSCCGCDWFALPRCGLGFVPGCAHTPHTHPPTPTPFSANNLSYLGSSHISVHNVAHRASLPAGAIVTVAINDRRASSPIVAPAHSSMPLASSSSGTGHVTSPETTRYSRMPLSSSNSGTGKATSPMTTRYSGTLPVSGGGGSSNSGTGKATSPLTTRRLVAPVSGRSYSGGGGSGPRPPPLQYKHQQQYQQQHQVDHPLLSSSRTAAAAPPSTVAGRRPLGW